jgi:hypothetical protein
MQLDVVGHACNPSTAEAEAGRVSIWGQSGLYNETLSQNKVIKNKKEMCSYKLKNLLENIMEELTLKNKPKLELYNFVVYVVPESKTYSFTCFF